MISTRWQCWAKRSTRATTQAAPGNTVPHCLKPRLVVMMVECSRRAPRRRAGGRCRRSGASAPSRCVPRPSSTTSSTCWGSTATNGRGVHPGQRDRAEVARRLDLTLLAPNLQELILVLESIDGAEPLSERALRVVAHAGSWVEQRAAAAIIELYV